MTLLFVDFPKAFVFKHIGKMEEILLAYVHPKETVTAIMILCSKTKTKACSPDRDTDFFSIVTGILQGDTLALYFFYNLHTSNIDRYNKKKSRRRRYLAKTITDTYNANFKVLLAITPT